MVPFGAGVGAGIGVERGIGDAEIGAEGLAAVVADRAEDVEILREGSMRVSYQITVTWPWASTARLGRATSVEDLLGELLVRVER